MLFKKVLNDDVDYWRRLNTECGIRGIFFFFEEIQDALTHHLEPSQSTDSNRFKAQLDKRNFPGKGFLEKLIFYSEWLIQDKSKKNFKIDETIKNESSLAEWLTKAVVDLISFYLNEELVISTLLDWIEKYPSH
ncbi:6538_t:CDS:2 [Funneliformis caledonium]|uniref:6538_t:CDS:1 n=1 Tax=Funneliformis caledonium TaxID=1117310 RepID=A0A9N9C0Y3_9GLOM|nr:6538_t:CDS:2 [Funneliformis caledonium]